MHNEYIDDDTPQFQITDQPNIQVGRKVTHRQKDDQTELDSYIVYMHTPPKYYVCGGV